MTNPACACNCGQTLTDAQVRRGARYATAACKTRGYRQRVEQATVTSQSPRKQTQVMLNVLRDRGPVGAHTFEFRRDHAIGNPSQRRADLEALGYTISSKRRRYGKAFGSQYVLTGEAGRQVAV